MKVIVGLGNPGDKYIATRHNFGFMVVDQLLKDCQSVDKTIWSTNDKLKSHIAVIPDVSGEKVILAKPQTFMNNSGMSVQLIASFYKIASEDIWIVYDELDLPLGTMRIRLGGAAAGHHGVESIIEHLGTDTFWRFRLGIGVSHDRTHTMGKQTLRHAETHVLGPFTASEQGKVREVIKHGSDALQFSLKKGIELAGNRFNTK